MKNKKNIIYIIITIILIFIVIGLVCYLIFNKEDRIKPDKYDDIEEIDTGADDDEIIEEEDTDKMNYNNMNFNSNLIKQSFKKENFLISPYSIEIALNLLKEGADGDTLKEFDNVLPNRTIKDITNNKIKVSNGIFIKNDYQNYIENTFTKNLKNKYNSDIIYDNFNTPDKINNWVKDKTDGMIEKILDRIDKDFVLGLANALAIDVNWKSEFLCDNTKSSDFITKDNKKIKVEMMYQNYTNNASYIEDNDLKGVIIPYENNLEFVGLIPNNIDNYINNLTDSKLNDIKGIELDSNNELLLYLPRFTYDYNIEGDNFKNILRNIGIKQVFDKSNSNLEKIINKNNLTKLNIDNLYVSDAIHKTHIELMEKGTKAAAVTYFGIFESTAINPEEKQRHVIEFNKPFIYMIRDISTHEILFFGGVFEPNLWNGTTCSEN